MISLLTFSGSKTYWRCSVPLFTQVQVPRPRASDLEPDLPSLELRQETPVGPFHPDGLALRSLEGCDRRFTPPRKLSRGSPEGYAHCPRRLGGPNLQQSTGRQGTPGFWAAQGASGCRERGAVYLLQRSRIYAVCIQACFLAVRGEFRACLRLALRSVEAARLYRH